MCGINWERNNTRSHPREKNDVAPKIATTTATIAMTLAQTITVQQYKATVQLFRGDPIKQKHLR